MIWVMVRVNYLQLLLYTAVIDSYRFHCSNLIRYIIKEVEIYSIYGNKAQMFTELIKIYFLKS